MSRGDDIARQVFNVARHSDGWAVEHNGEFSAVSKTKDEANATAHKMARASNEAGRAAMVTMTGDTGFFQARRTVSTH